MPRATAADLETADDARMEWAAQDILFDDDDVEVEVVDIEELDLEAALRGRKCAGERRARAGRSRAGAGTGACLR